MEASTTGQDNMLIMLLLSKLGKDYVLLLWIDIMIKETDKRKLLIGGACLKFLSMSAEPSW